MSSIVRLRFMGLALFVTLAAAQACGGDDGGSSGGTGNKSSAGEDAGGDGSGGTKPTGGSKATGGTDPSGTAGAPTDAGAGGDAPVVVPLKPRTGTAIVVDGQLATSENYRVLLTLGEGPSGNTTMKSTKHRVNLGVIGSTQ